MGSKLEAIDISNTSLVCAATVSNVLDGRVLVHFDGWEIDYDYWVVPSSSPYVHPVGWCREKGIELNPPKGKGKKGLAPWIFCADNSWLKNAGAFHGRLGKPLSRHD